MALLDHFGQPGIRQQLDLLLSKGRLPHAILFCGEPGSGTLPGALSLANDILCSSPKEGKACRQCASCNRASKFIHPDLHFLLPLAGAKSLTEEYFGVWREALSANPWLNVYQWTQFCDVEGKQVDIHKEDLQHVTSNLHLQSYEGGNKVLIIWMAQYLAKEGNRLLKMIEEPPANTYFILISNQREQILPTIRSRCMQLYFPPLERKEIIDLLRNEYKVEEKTANQIAAQSVNDMGRAISLLQNNLLDFKEVLTTWFRALVSRKGHELATWSNQMGSQGKEEQKQFVLFAMAFIRDILQPTMEGSNLTVESKEMIQYLQQNFNQVAWHDVIRQLQSGYEKIVRNANTKLLWLALSVSVKNHLGVNRLHYIKT